MFALIKLPFKLLSLPLMAVFSIMAFLVKILSNLSGYVLSPLILFVLGCGVYSVVCQQWNHVFLLGIIELCFSYRNQSSFRTRAGFSISSGKAGAGMALMLGSFGNSLLSQLRPWRTVSGLSPVPPAP